MPFNNAGRALQDAFKDSHDPQEFCGNLGLIRQTGMTPHSVKITQFDDRLGSGENPESWNQALPSKGCSQANLQSQGLLCY